LVELVNTALQQILADKLPADFSAAVTAANDLRFGDYQSNVAMVLSKQVGMNPRQLASQLCETLADNNLASVEIAGPGFINFRVKNTSFSKQLQGMQQDPRLGVEQLPSKRIVVDFSAPNVAKPMHVGHIRSTIIGDSLVRIARFLGHEVISDNHIGDWGTQFGMILWGWKHLLDLQALQANPISALLDLYKEVNLRCKADEAVLAECKLELVKLQSGDAQNLQIWQQCVDISRQGLEKIYQRLDVSFDYWLGESFYNPMLGNLVEDLLQKGIASESQGAVCIFSDNSCKEQNDPFLVQENGEWRANPAIIRKADGGFLYATTDLATLLYRQQEWQAEQIWYVVGVPQSQHFRQVFCAAARMGISSELQHVAFGSILGEDRKPFRTRSGDTVGLLEVLDESVSRATEVIREKNPAMAEEQVGEIAELVGIGAVKFAELSQHRLTDYVFSWDKMLALTGDTAPYLMYSCVRINSIFKRIANEQLGLKAGAIELEHDNELALGRLLVRYAELLPTLLNEFRPNLLANYLLEVARAYHSFFEACPVLKAEPAVAQSRLGLCELSLRVLQHGLGLLGIKVPERM